MTINTVRLPQLQLDNQIEVQIQRSSMTTKEEPPKPLISYFSGDKQPPLSGLVAQIEKTKVFIGTKIAKFQVQQVAKTNGKLMSTTTRERRGLLSSGGTAAADLNFVERSTVLGGTVQLRRGSEHRRLEAETGSWGGRESHGQRRL
jgi:hypothetical protein